MGQATRSIHHEGAEPAVQRRDRRLEAGFKPLALPALAAAVQARKTAPSRPVERDLPAFLREDALIG